MAASLKKLDPTRMLLLALVFIGEHAFQPVRLMLGDDQTAKSRVMADEEAPQPSQRTVPIVMYSAGALGSGSCHAFRMSINHTKSEKSQRKADELEERLNDRPDESENKEVEREESSRADIDSVRY